MKKQAPKRLGPARNQPQPSGRISWPNTMTFPAALRDAIPTPDSCGGRVLVLDSIEGQCQHSFEFGKRVLLRFAVRETGKLKGEFDVYADIDVEAARALAQSLEQLAGQVERMRPVSLTPITVRRKR